MLLYILLPCYNAEKTIERAILSILPQLSSDIKLLIINDGSTDSSPKLIAPYLQKSPHIEYIEQNNQGLSKALGAGITYLQDKKLSDECYVARLDSDDEYLPTGAQTLYAFIKKHPHHMCYIAGLLDEHKQALTTFHTVAQFFPSGDPNGYTAASFVDSVSAIINLRAFDNPLYSYDQVPARAGDGIPAMRIQRDFGYYLTNIYFYKVYAVPNSLSRRLITLDYAKLARETNSIILHEFLLQSPHYSKKEMGDRYLIVARYAAILKKYKESLSYLILGIKHNPKNFLYIGVALICLLPAGYKIVNFFVEKFLFKK